MDKLSIEEIEYIIEDYNNVGGHPNIILLAERLLDTMRENERLKAILNYVAVGEDSTIEFLASQYDHYRNKHSEKPYKFADMADEALDSLDQQQRTKT